MALVTYPLNNIEYSAEDAELFHVTRTSGIYANNSFDYDVTGADNNIVIGTGIGWIKNSEFSGKVIAQKEAISLEMGLPDPVYPRIDAIVIQFDNNRNETNVVVKKGTAASNPVAPSVVQNESVYELHLYHVRREAGSLYITPNNITDLRLNGSYCGLMADSVTYIDTAAIERQVADLIESLQNEISNVIDGSAYLLRNGSTNMTGNLPMDGHKVTGLGTPAADGDAVPLGYANQNFALAGYGFGGAPVVVSNNQLNSEADLNAALESIYSGMTSGETKLVKFYGYPSNSDDNWFGLLSKSSVDYGSLIIHSAYDKGDLLVKAKYGGTWQPVKPFVPSTRKVNGKALSGDITLNYSDVGAVYAGNTSPATAGFDEYGFVMSRLGNTYGVSGGKDNYYLFLDGYNNVKAGLQVNGSPEIVWNQIFTEKTPPKVKLWQNASRTSSFSPQTISVDLSGYDEVEVYYCLETESEFNKHMISSICPVGESLFPTFSFGSGNITYSRGATTNTSGVTFSAGYRSGGVSNTSLVPYRIFGIKGVKV